MTLRRLVLALAVGGVVAGITFAWVLPRIAGYAAVWRELRSLGSVWMVVLALVAVMNIATFALPWMVALPGLRFLVAVKVTQASTAFGLIVPGGAPMGMAASYALLRAASFEPQRIASAVALTGIWNQGSTLLFPVAAIVLLAASGTSSPALAAAAALGLVLTVLAAALLFAVLWRAALAQRVGDVLARMMTSTRRLVRRRPVSWSGDSLVRHRAEFLRLMRQRWPALTVATLANQLSAYLLFETSVRAVGIGLDAVSLPETFAAWSVARLLTSLPLTPGGVGFVELGLTGMLVGFGGMHPAVVAAVLAYRALSIVPTLALGLLAGAGWRLGTRTNTGA